MPEIKKGFLKAGMNLDVDERLVSQGEYREALNVRIASGSGSDKGSINSIESNVNVDPISKHNNATNPSIYKRVIGSVVDKETEKLYYFVKNNVSKNLVSSINVGEEPLLEDNGYVDIIADTIYELDKPSASRSKIVFNDVHHINASLLVCKLPEGTVNSTTTSLFIMESFAEYMDIREDMRVLLVNIGNDPLAENEFPFNEQNVWTQDAVYVDYVDRTSVDIDGVNYITVHFKSPFVVGNPVGPALIDLPVASAFSIGFRSKRLISDNSLNSEYTITGLNVLDGILYFSDNKSEPKRINIHRGKVGSCSLTLDGQSLPAWINSNEFLHTRLVVDGDSTDFTYGLKGYVKKSGIIEPHITVIRPNPEEPPKVLTDIATYTNRIVGGRTKGVMTHPFPIHPSLQPGHQLQFVVAAFNEAAVADGAGNFLPSADEIAQGYAGPPNFGYPIAGAASESDFILSIEKQWDQSYHYGAEAYGNAYLPAAFNTLAADVNPAEIGYTGITYGYSMEVEYYVDGINQGRLFQPFYEQFEYANDYYGTDLTIDPLDNALMYFDPLDGSPVSSTENELGLSGWDTMEHGGVSNFPWNFGEYFEGGLADSDGLSNGDFDEETGAPLYEGKFIFGQCGFRPGDEVTLVGKGNTTNSDSYRGRYPSQIFPGEYVDLVASTYSSMLSGSDDPTQNNTNVGQLVQGHRRSDGWGDTVKAKVIRVEKINEQLGYLNTVVRPEDDEQAGVPYGEFIALRDQMIDNNLVYDTTSAGSGTFFNDPEGKPATNYIVTIEIIQNNCQQFSPFRLDLCGYGNGTTNAGYNAACLYNTNKFTGPNSTPFLSAEDVVNLAAAHGAHFSALPPVPGQVDRFFGPELPQVWAVSVTSQGDTGGGDYFHDTVLQDSFNRFGYRYQYPDGEYSGFSPFSRTAFRAINQSIKWPDYYIRLTNEIEYLKLSGWVPKNVPEDVVAVELLQKRDGNVNIYGLEKYDYKTNEFNEIVEDGYKGLHSVVSTALGTTIDSNQLLRPYDTVPRQALGQEIIGNRLIYGNYLQDYNVESGVDYNESMMRNVYGFDLEDAKTKIDVDLSVSLYTYVDQILTTVLDVNGELVQIGLTDVDGTSTPYEEYYRVNDNYGRPQESIKSGRTYQIGIVYRDYLGRETPVLTSRNSIITVDRSFADKSTRFRVRINNDHPWWAKSYKIFVKDMADEYHTLPLFGAIHTIASIEDAIPDDLFLSTFENTTGKVSILIFDSGDVNKIKPGDTIIQKKPHVKNVNANHPLYYNTAAHEPDNANLEYEVLSLHANYKDLPNAEEEVPVWASGKFFVIVKTDNPLLRNNRDDYFEDDTMTNIARTTGIFETKPKELADVDLFYEASQAYPIVMDDVTDAQFVKEGRVVSGFTYNYANFGLGTLQEGDTIFTTTIGGDSDGSGAIGVGEDPIAPIVRVESITTSSGAYSQNTEVYSEIFLSSPVTLTLPEGDGAGIVLKLEEDDANNGSAGEHVFVELAESVVDSQTIKVKRHTHVSFFGLINNTRLPVCIPWSNCYSFGNGIEIDVVNNKFNGKRKEKGVKVSTIYNDYQEVRRKSSLIFSGIYNDFNSFNEANQFIPALGITKRFNPEHGSIQKLHARNTDLIALCEDKIIQVLANKDALFNSDGTKNLTATQNVLGQAVPFSGNYGISSNPESFASFGFRAYFTDARRGKVIRLSKDGLTPISNYGMQDYFNKSLRKSSHILGSFDNDKNEYIVSLTNQSDFEPGLDKVSVAFNEDTDRWTSFRSYATEAQGLSVERNFFSFQDGRIYKHNVENNFGEFYGVHNNSYVSVMFNDSPDVIKNFKSLSYEGTQARIIEESEKESGYLSTVGNADGWWCSSISTDYDFGTAINFINKENKWFKYIRYNASEMSKTPTEEIMNQVQNVINTEIIGLGSPIQPIIPGCTNPDALNYDPDANEDDGSCVLPIYGCTDPLADNYDPDANTDDGSCVIEETIAGCTNPDSFNYNPDANEDDGSCIPVVLGCVDPEALNYNELANTDDGSCAYEPISGCTNPDADNYNPMAVVDDGSCYISGCTNPLATNYNELATIDDDSCIIEEDEVDDGVNLRGTLFSFPHTFNLPQYTNTDGSEGQNMTAPTTAQTQALVNQALSDAGLLDEFELPLYNENGTSPFSQIDSPNAHNFLQTGVGGGAMIMNFISHSSYKVYVRVRCIYKDYFNSHNIVLQEYQPFSEVNPSYMTASFGGNYGLSYFKKFESENVSFEPYRTTNGRLPADDSMYPNRLYMDMEAFINITDPNFVTEIMTQSLLGTVPYTNPVTLYESQVINNEDITEIQEEYNNINDIIVNGGPDGNTYLQVEGTNELNLSFVPTSAISWQLVQPPYSQSYSGVYYQYPQEGPLDVIRIPDFKIRFLTDQLSFVYNNED